MTPTSLANTVYFDSSLEDIGFRDHEVWNTFKTAEHAFDLYLFMPPNVIVKLQPETPIGESAATVNVPEFSYVLLHKVPLDNHKFKAIYSLLDEGDIPDVVGLCSLDLAIAVSAYL